ncbi:ABC transporter ATP-binding protein [Lampropedia aestuarii]|uniref:ABC transporter ATP-binding protein n=1 Tax=Lampropedia aestuarii TaxID=2562762 RepID=A0A4S5BIH6_9BURK|nr:ABC transporter ATP-binding protein [Lampropedia aestuarii]MDH5858575.1 ABC transporter ATP-binding protein [Lampropedia aestuarii]THJ32130.1 ABC transporter ATP-binding protein [Lampropedia aestuarii]
MNPNTEQALQPQLSVRDLEVHYGPVKAVKGISFDLMPGRITTLVGANGAGKSTTLLALSGLVKKQATALQFNGRDIRNLKPHQLVASGLVQVAEGRATLTRLTVRENLQLGAYTRKDSAAAQAADLEHIYQLFPRLKERDGGLAGNLSGGEQQMLAIGRALMAKPSVLLLDEPSMGLAPIIVQDIFRTLQSINQTGLTIFLVEQNVRQALKISDYAYVLETGNIVLEGSGRSLLGNDKIQQAYLGG